MASGKDSGGRILIVDREDKEPEFVSLFSAAARTFYSKHPPAGRPRSLERLVDYVSSPDDGLRRVCQHPYDIVLVDPCPFTGSMEKLHQLVRAAVMSRAVVVMHESGPVNTQYDEQWMKWGVQYMPKPQKPVEMLEKVFPYRPKAV